MKIFFAGSIRGGRAQQPQYAAIVDVLKQHGSVASEHIASGVMSAYGETDMTGEEILARELKALEASDVVVAEVTSPSLGVGYLIARASMLGKKIVALYEGEDTLQLSEIIKGDAGIDVHVYKTHEDIEGTLQEIFSEA